MCKSVAGNHLRLCPISRQEVSVASQAAVTSSIYSFGGLKTISVFTHEELCVRSIDPVYIEREVSANAKQTDVIHSFSETLL